MTSRTFYEKNRRFMIVTVPEGCLQELSLGDANLALITPSC